MTDKELLTQFDAMCKEWYGMFGYSETSMLGSEYHKGREFHYIERVGFAGWNVSDDVVEDGCVQHLYLVAEDGDNRNVLCVTLLNHETDDLNAIFWSIHSLISKYFNIYYIEKYSIMEPSSIQYYMEKYSKMAPNNLQFSFLIKGIVVTKE